MAHKEQQEFVDYLISRFPDSFVGKKVLEVGSLNINGTVRDSFRECDYIGIDVGPGSCVDIVCPGQDFDAPDNYFDTICSLECFEHNPYWAETFVNMVRMCRPGGLIFFTCGTTGREEHGTTRMIPGASPLTIELGWDYYRNLDEKDIMSTMDFSKSFDEFAFITNTKMFDLYFFGIKKA